MLTAVGLWGFLNRNAPIWQRYLGVTHKVPGFWNGYRLNDSELHGNGYATYRLTVRLSAARVLLGLKVSEVSTAYRLYVNGIEMAAVGTAGKDREASMPRQYPVLLSFLEEERRRLGAGFPAGDYVFFMPESDGPCRFGLYNKYQRIVLDSLPGLKSLNIGAMTTTDSYSADGLIGPGKAVSLKKAAYLSVVVADILERLTWRVRPYEKEPGRTDAFVDGALRCLIATFEKHGSRNPHEPVTAEMDAILGEAADIIDPQIPPKPRIGIVGEIFLRMHPVLRLVFP